MNNRPSSLPIWKKLTVSGLLLVVPWFLTGCSLKSSKSAAAQKQTLIIWRQPVNKKAEDAAFDSIIAAFRQKNPNIKITYRSFDAAEDYEGAVLNSLASGQGPDIWEIRNDELQRHIDKLAPYPVTTPYDPVEFRKKYAAAIADEMLDQGKFYGMPMGIDPLMLYTNTSDFSTANISEIPKTWQDTIKDAVILTRKVNSTIFRPGFAMGTGSNIDHASDIVQLLMLQFKTQMVDPSHRTATFDLYNQDVTGQKFSYPGQNAVHFYAGFADPSLGYQTWDANQPYSTAAFAAGNLSMMIDYLSLSPQLKAINPKLQFRTSAIPQNLVRTYPQEDLPGGVSDPIYTARYRALVVSKPWSKLSEKDQQAKISAAWQFVHFATSGTVAANYDKQASLNLAAKPADGSSSTSSLDVFGVTSSSAPQSIGPYLATWYKGKSPRTVDQILGDTVKQITDEHQPVQESLTKAAQLITNLLP